MVFQVIEAVATRRGFAIVAALYLAVFGAILATLAALAEATGGLGILDFERGYSKDTVLAVFGGYGAEGMALYRRIQLLDLVNPALYGLLAAALTMGLWRGIGPRWLALAPLAAALGDYAENAALVLMVRAYPDIPERLVAIGSTLSLIKNGLLFAALGVVAMGVILRLWQRFSAPPRPPGPVG